MGRKTIPRSPIRASWQFVPHKGTFQFIPQAMTDITSEQREAIRNWEAGQEWELNGQDIPSEILTLAYQIASRRLLAVINPVMAAIRTDSVKWWAVQFALGTGHCEGHSMTTIAERIGVGRAAISKEATELCRRLGIPPSPYMKSAESQESYRDTRKDQVSETLPCPLSSPSPTHKKGKHGQSRSKAPRS